MLETPRKVTTYTLDIRLDARMNASQEYNDHTTEGPFKWSERADAIARARFWARQGGNVIMTTKEGSIVVERINIFESRTGEIKTFVLDL